MKNLQPCIVNSVGFTAELIPPDHLTFLFCSAGAFVCMVRWTKLNRTCLVKTIVENVYVWLVGPRHLVSEREGRW